MFMNQWERGEGRGKRLPSRCNSFKESVGVFYSPPAENSINHSHTEPFPREIAKKYPAVLNFRFLNLSSIKVMDRFAISSPLTLSREPHGCAIINNFQKYPFPSHRNLISK